MLNMPQFLTRSVVSMLALITIPGCRGSSKVSQTPQGVDSSAVRARLAGALANQEGTSTQINPADVQLVPVRSAIRPGLVYWWGVLRPKGTADIMWTATLAVTGTRSTLIRSAADWRQALGPWHPSSSESAINGCEELVSVAGPGADPFLPPVVASDSSRAAESGIAGSRQNDSLPAPQASVNPSDSTWTVRAWFRERGRAAQYACTFGTLPSETNISLLDSIPGQGFLPKGG